MNLEPTLSLRLLLPQNVHVPIIGTMTLTDFAIRVGLALLLGSLIGAEREWRHKLAGLKTNALVCVGSALFTCIGYQASSMGHADPTRIAGQIASGIGFLGAGAILRDGLTIRGLTTAATVWCAAAIGSLAGAGMLVHAVVGTGFIFGCNFALKEMAGMLFKHHNVDAPVEQEFILNFYTNQADPDQRKKIVEFFGAKISISEPSTSNPSLPVFIGFSRSNAHICTRTPSTPKSLQPISGPPLMRN